MKIFVALGLAGHALGSSDTPVSKVIELLTNMTEQSKKAKDAEEQEYNQYRRWCLDTQQATQQSIEDGNERMEQLNATIEKNQATINDNTRHIAVHDDDIATWNGDIKAANKVRDMENKEFTVAAKSYDESIDALSRAISTLQEQNFSRKQKDAALLQLRAAPGMDTKAIDAFLSLEEPDLEKDMEVTGYDFQSKGVIEMLKGLHDKFRQESEQLRHTETENKNQHSNLIESLNAQIAEATRERTRKAEIKGEAIENKATATSDLADTTATRDDDQKFLAAVTAQCSQKASDFEARTKMREEEIVALEKATEILSSKDVKGAAAKHLPQGFTQTSFVQFLSTVLSPHDEDQARVSSYLKIKGAKLHSTVLSALAERVAVDPFVKVKKLIQDLVVRLQEEAANEATEKQWCDDELQSNENTRKQKTAKVEKLHAKSDLLKATISKLAEDITELQAAIAKIDKDVKEATTIRASEKAENTAAIKDAKSAQKAVAQALKVLQEFYAKAGDATSLVQTDAEEPRPTPPPVFDRPYKGLQAENGGVIGMIEVIQSDFARLESETKASEEQSQKEYDEFMADAEANKAQKQKDIEHKMIKKQDTEQELQETTSDLEGTQEELAAALSEYDKLKQQCLDTGLDYDERVRRREEEIESLRHALRILEDPEAVF